MHMVKRSFVNYRLEAIAFKGRARTAGNQTIEAVLKGVATAREARYDLHSFCCADRMSFRGSKV